MQNGLPDSQLPLALGLNWTFWTRLTSNCWGIGLHNVKPNPLYCTNAQQGKTFYTQSKTLYTSSDSHNLKITSIPLSLPGAYDRL